MPYCIQCGTPVDQVNAVCASCGARQPGTQTAAAPATSTTAQPVASPAVPGAPAERRPEPPGAGLPTALRIFGWIELVAGVIVAAVLFDEAESELAYSLPVIVLVSSVIGGVIFLALAAVLENVRQINRRLG